MVNLNLQTPDCNHKSSNKAIESKICAERYCEIPLFLFGVFITILVAIGVVLAVVELRQAHTPRESHEGSGITPRSPTPTSSS